MYSVSEGSVGRHITNTSHLSTCVQMSSLPWPHSSSPLTSLFSKFQTIPTDPRRRVDAAEEVLLPPGHLQEVRTHPIANSDPYAIPIPCAPLSMCRTKLRRDKPWTPRLCRISRSPKCSSPSSFKRLTLSFPPFVFVCVGGSWCPSAAASA